VRKLNNTNEQADKKKKRNILDLGKNQKTQTVVILLVVSAVLLIYFANPFGNLLGVNEKSETVSVTDDQGLNGGLESNMASKLSLIAGAGRVEVIISYETSKELVPVYVEDIQTSVIEDKGENSESTSRTENHQSEIVTMNSNASDSALIIKEKSAVIKGVVVIAQGAHDIKVKMDLLNAVCTLLNISPDQIEVYEMNKEY